MLFFSFNLVSNLILLLSGYAGPPSVASSYHQDDMNQEMSHVDHHQISHQDDQWAKATGQDISGLSFNVSLTYGRNLFS